MGFSIRTTGLVLCLGLTAPVMAQDESSACLGLLDGMRLVIATAPEVAAAQAMVAEASYLGWLQPQGAPFALEDIDLSHQDVVAAEDVTQSGVARAKGGRQTLDAQTGPRFEQAKNEERVAQVFDTVRRKIEHLDDLEAQRLGKLARALARRLL